MRPSADRRATTSVLGLGVAALTLAGGLAACSSSSKAPAGAPAGSTSAAGDPHSDPHKATVTITSASGCTSDKLSFPAGGITFEVTNKDATAVSEIELLSGERIVGEKENLPPGFSGSFAVTADAGSYTLYCPGAAKENTTVTVTGTATSSGDQTTATLLKTGTAGYAKYVTTQVGYLLQSTQALDTALHGTDLAAAQAAYMKARPFYEKIEPVAESFTSGKDNLDADIDARAGDVPASQWTGFHPVEKGLFATKSLAGLGPLGDGLVSNVKKLQTLTAGLSYQPTELANGAQELLDEVSGTKITGEEERYSHIDLLDFQANDEGAEQAFAQLQPALQKIDAGLASTIATQFTALDTLLDKYRSATNPSGFELYTQLSTADKKALAAAVKAVQEPLSQVGSKVANA
jgi:iron uptake system component EfeO